MRLSTILVIITAVLSCTDGARILGIFPMPGISHKILGSKLMQGLAEAGHDVTVVSPYALKDRPKNGNYTDVILDGFVEKYDGWLKDFNFFESGKNGKIQEIMNMFEILYRMTNETMYHPKMIELAASNQHFDALIMEQIGMDAHKIYPQIFNCPLIILSSVGPNSEVNSLVGNPEVLSYAPSLAAGDFTNNLTLWNRAKSLLSYFLTTLVKEFFIMPKQDTMLHTIYPDAPPLVDLQYNVSLVLLNSDTSLYPALPLVPNMIEIGGYFIDPPNKLPQDLQEFLDNAKDGVIYFSMGSNLRSKDMPEERKRVILNVLGKLKEKVLWKFEEDLPGKPSNVMIRKWLPQPDILAHPNVKLFITHGGLLSTTETVYHGVPILAIPVFADQPANAARAEANGYGLKLGYNDPDFTEERLSFLINELLNNPIYRETVKQKSKIFHDRPMKPIDTAAYWVDYVIRHKGAPHLRVAGLKLPWYKNLMLDVIGVILLVPVSVLWILKCLVKKLLCRKSARISKKLKRQ